MTPCYEFVPVPNACRPCAGRAAAGPAPPRSKAKRQASSSLLSPRPLLCPGQSGAWSLTEASMAIKVEELCQTSVQAVCHRMWLHTIRYGSTTKARVTSTRESHSAADVAGMSIMHSQGTLDMFMSFPRVMWKLQSSHSGSNGHATYARSEPLACELLKSSKLHSHAHLTSQHL